MSEAAEALAADDKLNVMVYGVRSRSSQVAGLCPRNREYHVKNLCDVDKEIGQNRMDEFEKHTMMTKTLPMVPVVGVGGIWLDLG